jgi:DNA topoisomerase-1
LRAYVEGSDDPQAELADRETVLPDVKVGDSLECRAMEPKSHSTQPPSRYNEATLTRALEELGIGRPSTYAAIIDTILAREYVFKRGNALVPTWTAFAVAKLLQVHLPNLVDYRFTAQMEDDLDAISRGEAKWVDYLHGFYFGNGQAGLKEQLKHKVDEIDARDVSRISLGAPNTDVPSANGEAGGEIFVRVGRYGPFLEQGERRASIPDGFPPDELTIPKALEMLEQASQGDEPLGICPDTHKPVYLKVGRFGPYVQRGTPEDEEKPQNASLLKGMRPEDITFEVALKLLTLPRELGPHPESNAELAGQPITAYNGRFGPYVKCGAETRSLPSELSPLDVTLAQAVELLAQPKKMRRGFGAPKEPLKTFGESPVTKQGVQLLEGRYGPYVTDGVTNASVPKGTSIEELTPEAVLNLLAERAAMGPSKKAARRKAAPKKAAAAPKKAVKKKTAKKAASPKKSAKKPG